MSERVSRPVVLDATVLSNYASTEFITWLTTTLDALQTVPAVRTELEQGREVGYAYLEHALDVLESGEIGIAETAPEQLQQDYPKVQTRLDPGEAESLVAAHTAGGALVTDDGTARTLAADYDVALTGSIGLLVRGVVLEELTVETADEWLTTWIEERNYYAPVDSVTAALPDDVEE
jgi:predicted nucleic acid-binding protein